MNKGDIPAVLASTNGVSQFLEAFFCRRAQVTYVSYAWTCDHCEMSSSLPLMGARKFGPNKKKRNKKSALNGNEKRVENKQKLFFLGVAISLLEFFTRLYSARHDRDICQR